MADQTTPTRIVGLEQPRHDDQRQERTRYETGGEGDDAPVASFETETVMLGGAPSYGSAGAPAPTSAGRVLEDLPGYHLPGAVERAEARALGGAATPQAEETRPEAPVLDAWFADLPMRSGAEVLGMVQEVLIGYDDRVQVSQTRQYPWRCICALEITAADGTRWIGTGFFVGPRTVLTAGHCVYIHGRGGWARSIRLVPGANGSEAPFGALSSGDLRSVRGWTEKRLRTHDYGAIILPRSYTTGEQIGWFGYVNLPDVELSQAIVNLSGYPGDKPPKTQWFHGREVTRIDKRTLTYLIDTMGGQSGSPVWRIKDGQRHVVGIHTNGDESGNSATRVCDPVVANIKRWIEEGG